MTTEQATSIIDIGQQILSHLDAVVVNSTYALGLLVALIIAGSFKA